MMSVLARQHSISDTGVESPRCDSRLVFPPSATAQGVVDGSWWPRTRDPATELPALIAAVTDRMGMVDRIMLNADACVGHQTPANHHRRTARGPTSSTVPPPRMCPPRRQPPPHHRDTAGHRNPRFRVVRGP
jgi:hypothetical protein